MDIEKKIDALLQENDEGKAPEIKKIEEIKKEEITVDVSEGIAALSEGEELSDEFKAKAAAIFESTVINRVKQEIAKLEENFDARVATAVEAQSKGLIEQVDGYLSYIAEEWMTQNEIALERGMKSEVLEGFVSGLKSLFEEHYIDVPDEKLDFVSTLETANTKLETKLSEQIDANVELKKSLVEMQRADVVSKLSEGLTDTENEKFKALAEDLSFDSIDTFTAKVKTIRESYFTGKPAKEVLKSVIGDAGISEEEETEKHIDPAVKSYLAAIKTLN